MNEPDPSPGLHVGSTNFQRTSVNTAAPDEGAVPRLPLLRRVAVLGAGTMGSRIAAHLANAGLPVILLDIVPEGAIDAPGSRSLLAAKAVETLLKSKPAAFMKTHRPDSSPRATLKTI